ncbi:MAG: NrsF family protein [Myxococcales bacterium]
MACTRALELLPGDAAGADAHARECEACCAVVGAWRAVEAPPGPRMADAAEAGIRRAALRELRHSPRAGSWRVAAGFVGAAAAITGGLMAVMMPDSKFLKVDQPAAAAGYAGMLVLTQFMAGWWALRPKVGRLHAVTLFGGLLVGLQLLGAPGLASEGVAARAKEASCLGFELAVAFIPVVLGLLALRHNAPSLLRGALVGTAAGAAGTFALYFHCSNLSVAHLALFHLGGWGLVVGGAAVAAKLLRPRAYAP